MAQITLSVSRQDVYEEVAKATDYTVSKLTEADDKARDRILAGDAELADLGRLWAESVAAANEYFKELLISGRTATMKDETVYTAQLEVSAAFDTALTESVESSLRSYFIASIIGQWFKFANKGEASDYFTQAAEMLESAERMLYSRKKPKRPAE